MIRLFIILKLYQFYINCKRKTTIYQLTYPVVLSLELCDAEPCCLTLSTSAFFQIYITIPRHTTEL